MNFECVACQIVLTAEPTASLCPFCGKPAAALRVDDADEETDLFEELAYFARLSLMPGTETR
jgi:hypothetical protein